MKEAVYSKKHTASLKSGGKALLSLNSDEYKY
jgi:hypothetical protein